MKQENERINLVKMLALYTQKHMVSFINKTSNAIIAFIFNVKKDKIFL